MKQLAFLLSVLLLLLIGFDLNAQNSNDNKSQTLLNTQDLEGPVLEYFPAGIHPDERNNAKQGYCSTGAGIEQSFTDSQGNLYVADNKNEVIRIIRPNGKMKTISEGVAEPIGIVVDSKGNIFYSNQGGIHRIDAKTKKVSWAAKRWMSKAQRAEQEIKFVSTGLSHYLAIDKNDIIYFSDYQHRKIKKLNTKSGQVSIVAGSGKRGFENGPAMEASFDRPVAVALDSEGNIYVTERESYYIQKISTDGIVTNFAGCGLPGFKDGNKNKARFNSPKGMAFDKQGNLYVADRLNFAVRKIDTEGKVTTLSGTGISGNKDGKLKEAQLGRPVDVSFSNGQLYIMDWINHSIRTLNTGKTKKGQSTKLETFKDFSDTNQSSAFILYPNPLASGQTLSLEVKDETLAGQDVLIFITNLLGQEVYRKKINRLDKSGLTLDLPSQIPAGEYLLNINCTKEEKTYVEQFSVVK